MDNLISIFAGSVLIIAVFSFGACVGKNGEKNKPCTHQIQSITTNTVITTNWSK